ATNNVELSGPMTVSNAVTATTVGDSMIKFSGIIDGPGGFTKDGTNSLILTGANTYAGNTAVNGGTLVVNNTSGSGTGANSVTVNPGGTLGGTGTVAGPVTVFSGGRIGAGASAGTLTVTNGLELTSGGTNIWELATNSVASGSFDQIVLT